MTAIAEKVIKESLNLTVDDQFEVMSRLAIQNGLTELHEQIENAIAERRADEMESGVVKGMSEEEVFGKYRKK